MTQKRKQKLLLSLIAISAIALGCGDNGARPPDEVATAPKETPETIPQPAYVETESIDKTTETTWATYHGGPALTGAVDQALPDSPAVLWRYQAQSPVYNTPVASENGIFFSTTKGWVVSLDFDGNEIWSTRLVREIKDNGIPRYERIDAPSACFENAVLVGCVSGALYALDAGTGAQKWKYDVEGPILGTVNVHDGSVFVIDQQDGILHSIDLATGARRWRAEAIARCDGSPSVTQDTVIYGSCAAALHVFSMADGALLKNIEIGEDSQVAGGVALDGNAAFSGSHSGKVFNVDTKTGSVVWINEDSQDEVLTTPAVNRDWVVFGSFDDYVYGLDRATGMMKWKFNTDGYATSPVIAQDKVIVGSDGTLYLLRLESGELLWSYEVSDEITSPAIINGMIVAGSEDGVVTAFGAARD